MNSRRKFLIQGSLATTAILVTNPFNAIARAASPFAGFTGSHNNLVFLHTVSLNPGNHYKAIQYIADIKRNTANTILLHAGEAVQDDTGKLQYDVPVNSGATGDYSIIYKGGIKTGVVRAAADEPDVIKKINAISAYLKKEKNCQVVVCLSGLGYKNKNAIDDITLAEKSTCLDIIIGGHSDNFFAHPVIALNNNKGEVIIHSAAGNNFAVGKIEIDFDEKGRKRRIGFSDSLLPIHDKNTGRLTA